MQGTQGSSMEFSNPEGFSCRHRDSNQPRLAAGIGIGSKTKYLKPNSVVSSGSVMEEVSQGESFGPLEPIIGISIQIPLGETSTGNCKTLMKLDDANFRVLRAEEMFSKGLITQEELEAVAVKAFKIINDFD